MSVLAGPFAIACILLAAGGALKAYQPGDTATALGAVGIRASRSVTRGVVRIGGAVEAVVGIAALLTGAPALAVLVAISYLAFAGFVVAALRSGVPISSCGCFGKVDTPPSRVHLVVNVGFSGVAAGAAVVGGLALPDMISEQPLAGIPFVLLLAIGCYAAFLALTALPKTMAAVRGV